MNRDQDKHKRIVRKRFTAIAVALLLLCIFAAVLFIGIRHAVSIIKQNIITEERSTEEPSALNEEPLPEEASSAAVEISAPGDKNPDKETEEAVSGEELAEQYEEVVNAGDKTANALEIEEKLDKMSLEDKVSQLFFVRPEQITGADAVTKAGDATKAALQSYHVGGLIYFSNNLLNREQTRALLQNTMEFAKEGDGIPVFLALDEEGGDVTRIAANPEFGIEGSESMKDIGKSGDQERAFSAGKKTGEYLKELGFNLDMAPVADVAVQGSAIGDRAFGNEGELVSKMALKFTSGLNESGIIACYKHFPGFGRSTENTDTVSSDIDASVEELRKTDLIPYTEAASSGNEMMIMAGHMSFSGITGDDTPSSMSVMMITDYLRGELKYNGVVITDALDAAAVKQRYSSAEAALKALKAGADMLLCPADFKEAYEGVLNAVREGEITEDRINTSVSRILALKSVLK